MITKSDTDWTSSDINNEEERVYYNDNLSRDNDLNKIIIIQEKKVSRAIQKLKPIIIYPVKELNFRPRIYQKRIRKIFFKK